MKRNIILHLFQYKLLDIIPYLDKIKEQGFTHIQISPIQKVKQDDGPWWMLYQSCGFEIGNKQIGTKEDFKLLCIEAHKRGLQIICDVILNHVAGDNYGNLIPYESVDKLLTSNKYFFKEPKIINNWNNRYEVINYCCKGLPTLRLDNYDLQDLIINFLNELIDYGADGFRIDSAKQIALPEEGSDFFIRVFNNLKNKDNLFNYAEVIFEEKSLIDKYCKYINVLTNSFGSDKSKMVTFFESHDSFLEFGYTKNMSNQMMINEWETLFKTGNWSTIFYARPFDDLWQSKEIKDINLKYNLI